MTIQSSLARSAAIVLGCGEVGSAVAVVLHQAGMSVVLVDEADPSWHRRGMAFTNAWYVGNAELENEGACFCASLKSMPSILARRMIAATTWSWPGVAATLEPALLVDARGSKRRGSAILRGRVPLTIGIGSGFVEGEHVEVAIDIPGAIANGSRWPPVGHPHQMLSGSAAGNGHTSGSTVEATRHGRFMTERRIGELVRAGQIVGGLGNEVVAAPMAGVLLGLAARGARIEPGDTLLEVDPEGQAHRCYGIGAGPRRLAAEVLSEFEAGVGGPRELPVPVGAGLGTPVAR
jgi:xanthine dehydrogenase accessory factor